MKLSYENLAVLLKFISKELANKKIIRINTINDRTIYFNYDKEKQCLINLDNNNPQIAVGVFEFEQNRHKETQFLQILKRELNNSIITKCELYGNDKIVHLEIQNINQFYQQSFRNIYIELIPFKPNLIICNDKDIVISAYRESELSNKRIIKRNFKYDIPNDPIKHCQDNNDFTIENYNKDILLDIKKIVAIEKENEYQDINKYIVKRIKSLEKKINKLDQEAKLANESLKSREVADYLSANREQYQNVEEFIYDGNTIKLDTSKDINKNIECLYNRYKKSKVTIVKSQEFIEKSQEEIVYYKSLSLQLEDLDSEELNQIREELGLIKINKKTIKKIHKRIPYYQINYGTSKIIFGKNNIENDNLTFELANRNDYWFHIKDGHGSHLIIKSDDKISDKIMLLAAEIILILAKRKDGDVYYTQRKNLHRGNFLGEAKMKQYQIIHINRINNNTLEMLKNAKKVN